MAFDRHYRMDIANNVGDWGQTRFDLIMQYSRDFAPNPLGYKSTPPLQPSSQFGQGGNIQHPRGYCYNFHNVHARCTYVPCTMKHECYKCHARHPVYVCNVNKSAVPSKEGSSSAVSRPLRAWPSFTDSVTPVSPSRLHYYLSLSSYPKDRTDILVHGFTHGFMLGPGFSNPSPISLRPKSVGISYRMLYNLSAPYNGTSLNSSIKSVCKVVQYSSIRDMYMISRCPWA